MLECCIVDHCTHVGVFDLALDVILFDLLQQLLKVCEITSRAVSALQAIHEFLNIVCADHSILVGIQVLELLVDVIGGQKRYLVTGCD